ncbi:MAG: GNAT family N-acetyltransferase [Planctomycetes bacterium]|nr:GNAT family N-acetyltransferase [Planctomycetota bacterium]
MAGNECAARDATVGPARAEDLSAIRGLLGEAGLPIPGAGDPPVSFVVARGAHGGVSGCAGWEVHDGRALLRSVAVRAAERRGGVGGRLVAAALEGLRGAGVREVCLVTMGAAAFFARQGFAPIARDAVPASLRRSPEFDLHCCGHGTWMLRTETGAAGPGGAVAATAAAAAAAHVRPPVPPGPLVSLVYRVKPERRGELLAFLRDAFPFYESPGGIRMALYEDVDQPGRFLELVAYDGEPGYAADQVRIERDPECRARLEAWRGLLDGPVEVLRARPVDPGAAGALGEASRDGV